jgi:hypothetical protein
MVANPYDGLQGESEYLPDEHAIRSNLATGMPGSYSPMESIGASYSLRMQQMQDPEQLRNPLKNGIGNTPTPLADRFRSGNPITYQTNPLLEIMAMYQ